MNKHATFVLVLSMGLFLAVANATAKAPLCSPFVTSVAQSNTETPYEMEIARPALCNAKANAQVNRWMDGVIKDFVADGNAAGEDAADNLLVISLAGQEEHGPYLSLKFVVEEYMGGAHPEVSMETFVLDMQTGNRLTTQDMFTGEGDPMAIIATHCTRIIEQKRGYALPETEKRGLWPSFNNYKYFALTKKGIAFYFPVYQTGARGEGEQSATLPYSLVSKWLRPEIATQVQPQ